MRLIRSLKLNLKVDLILSVLKLNCRWTDTHFHFTGRTVRLQSMMKRRRIMVDRERATRLPSQ